MNQILAIALNTFRESIRNRIFASLGFFAVVLLVVVAAVSRASLHEEIRLMKDLGLFLVSTFAVVIAVFVGVNLLYQEMQRKTVYTVMPKPIYRFQFLLGKYVGLAATMAVLVLAMGVALRAMFFVFGADFGLTMAQALWLIYVEVTIVIAVALLFSSFSTPFLSGLLTFGVFVVGRFHAAMVSANLLGDSEDVGWFGHKIEQAVAALAAVTPKLSYYNVTPQVVYDAQLSWEYVGYATLQGVWYAAILLILASMLFSIRDFV